MSGGPVERSTDTPPVLRRKCAAARCRACGALTFALLACCAIGGCGKKGPPLPPLVRLPVAPPEAVASRRGSNVEVQFVVPGANTDGSRPADISRVDVYALTGAEAIPSGEEVVRRGSKVGTVQVNPPPDPDEDPDAVKPPDPKAKPKTGIDQGTIGKVTEDIASLSASGARSYVSVGVSSTGRRGQMSPRSAVPLGPAPAAPPAPTVTYTETTVSISWAPPVPPEPAAPPAYHVYETGLIARRLTDRPLVEPPYTDKRIEWGIERCFALRTVQSTDGLTMESDASTPACVTLVDTFPPAAPTGLTAVAAEGSISLIWNASTEADAAGYLVLRAIAPATTPVPVTPTPIRETTFRDAVSSGTRVIYAVQAVDSAGNVSAMSSPIEETAR